MAFDISSGKQRSVMIAFVKADGSPGEVEGAPIWELSEDSLADLEVAADGMSAVIGHIGATGTTRLEVRADGDLGVGVFPIFVGEDFVMRAPLGATAAAFTVGDEEDIVVPSPILP